MKQKNEFVQFYPDFFNAYRNLSLKGFKILDYILTKIRPRRDRFFSLFGECTQHTNYKSRKQLMKIELIYNGIIARETTEVVYFINPMALFERDRLAFIKNHLRKQAVN